MFKCKNIIASTILALTLLFPALHGQAAIIKMDTEQVSQFVFESTYTVENTSNDLIEQVSIYFDYGLSDNISIVSQLFGWDGIALQSIPFLFADGLVDILASDTLFAIDIGQTVELFTAQYEWFGVNAPGPQFYEIIDPATFTVLSSGMTQISIADPVSPSDPPATPVPTPPSLWLFSLGALFIFGLNRFKALSKNAAFTAALLVSIIAAPFATATERLSINKVHLSSVERISRTDFQYTVFADIKNSSAISYPSDTEFYVNSENQNISMARQVVHFRPIPAHSTVDSDNSFTFIVDRRYRLNVSDFLIKYDDPFKLEGSDLDGSGLRDDVEEKIDELFPDDPGSKDVAVEFSKILTSIFDYDYSFDTVRGRFKEINHLRYCYENQRSQTIDPFDNKFDVLVNALFDTTERRYFFDDFNEALLDHLGAPEPSVFVDPITIGDYCATKGVTL